MYNLNDFSRSYIVITLSVALQIIGSFFLLNLILAVLANSLDKSVSIQEAEENQRKTSISISVRRMQTKLNPQELESFNHQLTKATTQPKLLSKTIDCDNLETKKQIPDENISIPLDQD